MNKNFCPFISIVIPAYNVEDYIGECLESLLHQSCSDFEVIVINDGSCDNTMAVAKAMTDGNKRFSFQSQENAGLGVTRNRGLALARGNFIYFLDADDKVSTDFVLVAKSELFNTLTDIWGFNAEVFFDEAEKIMQRGNYLRSLPEAFENPLHELLRTGQFKASVCLHVFRRAFLDERNLRFLANVKHEDEAFTLQATLLARKTLFSPSVFFFRRLRPNSLMTSDRTFSNVSGYFSVFVALATWKERDRISKGLLKLLDERVLIIFLWSLRGALRLEMLHEFRKISQTHFSLLFKHLPLRYALAPFVPLPISKLLSK